MAGTIPISAFQYSLPEERIAKYPLANRDQAKLLHYKQGEIFHRHFYDLPSLLPANSTLYFNNTKVIPARIKFRKETGTQIEVFLLNPVDLNVPLQQALQAKENTQWQCTIGNLKKWKPGTSLIYSAGSIVLEAKLVDPEPGIVEFSWNPSDLSFAEIVEQCGLTPLPPYLHRDAEPEDKLRYQTIYSRFEGAVAAPTAGLHFTKKVMDELQAKSIATDFFTLHVSAGTFQPVKGEDAMNHTMHSEQIVITRKNIENLLDWNRLQIAVGTTAVRTMESIYWYGTRLLLEGTREFNIRQGDPYRFSAQSLPSKEDSLRKVLSVISSDNTLVGQTSIYIVPGYQFRICDALITNFHQPGSTLMLLIAAFVGDHWRHIYDSALENNYRFLSYGDSSLLFP